MYLDSIRESWFSEIKNSDAAIDMWDSMAGQFSEYKLPEKDDLLMKIVCEENMISSQSKVLDIGCGAGRHAAAIASLVSSVTAVDLSPKMIEYGKKNISNLGINNVELVCEDWSKLNIKEKGFEKEFDLVYAHMTPAINDALTFEKMICCTKKHGILFKPSRRNDEISDKIMEMAGVKRNTLGSGESIVFAFGILFLNGLNPKVKYNEQVWSMKKSFEEACSMYINRVKTYGEIDTKKENIIKEYLEKKLDSDGNIVEKVNTIISIIYW